MSDSRNTIIGVLSLSAVVLLVGVVLTLSRPQVAHAGGAGIEGGKYVMAIGSIGSRTDALYVIDSSINQMGMYTYDFKTGKLVPYAGTNFDDARMKVRQAGGN